MDDTKSLLLVVMLNLNVPKYVRTGDGVPQRLQIFKKFYMFCGHFINI